MDETKATGIRIPMKLFERIETERDKQAKETGLNPSINDVMRMLIEKGLETVASERKK